MRDTHQELFLKYVEKKGEVGVEVARLEAELAAARERQRLIEGMLSDMQALSGGASAPRPAASVAAPRTEAPAAAPAAASAPAEPAERPAGKRGSYRPKGRPAASVSPRRAEASNGNGGAAEDSVGELSIVDAAIQLARLRGQSEAKASDVQGWFEEAGYEGRNGTPNRNSIYVSLNREANQTADDPNARIRKERRGVFKFL